MKDDTSRHKGSIGVWKVQSGRSRLQRRVLADGFVGEYPYAGVVVVAEALAPDDDPSPEIAVSTVRDVFAESVAFGIEEALLDAFHEASDTIRRNGHAGCSAAAVAFAGTHAWFVSTGACRILKMEPDSMTVLAADGTTAESSGIGRDHPEYPKSVRELHHWLGGPKDTFVSGHTRIGPDAVVTAATPGVWMHLRDNVSVRKKSCRNLEAWLETLLRETRVAYRRQGGAMAAAGCVSGGRPSLALILPLAAVLLLVILGILLASGVFESKGSQPGETDLFDTSEPVPDTVMPLPLDSVSRSFWGAEAWRSLLADSGSGLPDLSGRLPLETVLVGGEPAAFPADTFLLTHNSNPSPDWENFRPGIYPLAGDTAALHLAELLSSRNPNLPVIPLSTIVVVRENGVADAARWLRELNPADASRIGVVVETRSSVAGGAQWIRNYPVFVNGNRDHQDLPGVFLGDSLPGMPVFRSHAGYCLVFVP